jgi:hypothetical protein
VRAERADLRTISFMGGGQGSTEVWAIDDDFDVVCSKVERVHGPPDDDVNDPLVWRWSGPDRTFTVTRFVAVHRGTPLGYRAVSAKTPDGEIQWDVGTEIVLPEWTACCLTVGEAYVIAERRTNP